MLVRRLILLVLFAGLGTALPARAAKLDKKSKRWLGEVRAIILPEEDRLYRELQDRSERKEFERIFWGRRDPDLETKDNEYRKTFDAARGQADERYRAAGRAGSRTDCGRVFILMGEPDKVDRQSGGLNRGPSSPQVWTYLDRPGFTFADGKLMIAFDSECRLTNEAFHKQLDRVAAGLVAHPNLAYKVEKGRIAIKLEDMLPKPTAAQALLKEPRQDFPLEAQTGYLKVADGSTLIQALVKADAADFTIEELDGQRLVRAVVCAQAVRPDGTVASFAERAVDALVKDDGSLVASYKMQVKPGTYTIKSGLLEEATGRGSIVSQSFEAPNLDTGQLAVASLLVLEDITDVAEPDAKHAYDAYTLGGTRLVPRFGRSFKQSESASFFSQVYDGQLDAETGKPSVTLSLSLRNAKRVVAKAGDANFDTPVAGNVVGPVPLAKYEPGAYTAKLEVRDNVAAQELVVEVPFTIEP